MKIQDFFSIQTGEIPSPVITIGMFDGIHLGHQSLFNKVKYYAQKKGGESIVITFPEHPRKILENKSIPTILSFPKKLEQIEKQGIQRCLVMNFNKEIATIPAQIFIEKYLIQKIGIAGIVAGKNFQFGYQGMGNLEMLKKFSSIYAYDVWEVETQEYQEEIISSTNVRKAVSSAQMTKAQAMLGRPFSLRGQVVLGRQRGRNLGFPTANLELEHQLLPPEGVYCGYSVLEDKKYFALISIGTCPTFREEKSLKIEVYLLGFSGNLYGTILETFVCQKIRDQKTFSSVDELCQQIKKDREYLLNFFSQKTTLL
ncbi:MAG: bifunctional riboflavin kinase/FAD synthetase [Candidatus Brocadiae bacterium]|nr:bifunctional riboflavin kinase/FAD synthetase [Candidatus Brocadiia bacterium]